MVKIKTTHVGSLPRSNELSNLLASKDNEELIDINSFDEVVKKNVSSVVILELDYLCVVVKNLLLKFLMREI